jgi:hypothetical protein
MTNPENARFSEEPSRRDLLTKAAVGAGVTGLAWMAPRIEGLSLRPDYAAAQSGSSDPGDGTGPQPFSVSRDIGNQPDGVDTRDLSAGVDATLTWLTVSDFVGDVQVDVVVDGADACTFDGADFVGALIDLADVVVQQGHVGWHIKGNGADVINGVVTFRGFCV